MPAAIPALEINRILGELSQVLDMAEPDAFHVRRLDVEVERLWQRRAVDPEEYHFTKAFVAVAKRQRGAAIASAINALRLAPRNDVVQTNVLTVLVGVLEVDQAIRLIHDMVASHPDDKEVLTSAIIKAGDLMQFTLVAQLFEAYDKLAVNDPNVPSVRRPTLERNIQAMNSAQLTDADMADRLKSVVDVLFSAGHEIWRCSRSSLSDGTLLYYMHIDASPAVCADLNFLIADRLVEQFDNPGWDFVSFSCRPLKDLSEMNALPADCL